MKISLYPPLSVHELGQRDNQEDALWPLVPTEDDQLFVLCDGMGGHEHGEIASQTVSQAFGAWYQSRAIHPITKAQFEDAFAYAYALLDQKDNGEFKKMGTTLTLLYIGSEGVVAAHMGDSRIYHIRPGVGILYQSRDHSLVFDLYQSGEITYDEMQNFTQKNIVTRAMTPGEDNRYRPDIIQITDIMSNDYFFMCSDGMLEQMSNEDLVKILSKDISDEEKRQQLITVTSNNQDNHSAWFIHVKDVVREEQDNLLINEETTARCNVLNIKPNTDSSDDVMLIDNDDVSVVSASRVSMKTFPRIKVIISVLSFLLALVLVCFLCMRNKSQEGPAKSSPIMRTPIKHNHSKVDKQKSIVKDTNKTDKHESRH